MSLGTNGLSRLAGLSGGNLSNNTYAYYERVISLSEIGMTLTNNIAGHFCHLRSNFPSLRWPNSVQFSFKPSLIQFLSYGCAVNVSS